VWFSAFFRSDHLLVMGDGDGLPGPTDAWTTLAGLARDTNTIRLGTMVTSATFRHPGLLAVQVAQVDQMSGGRVELGLGAGWSEREHAAYGIPFPESVGERFERRPDATCPPSLSARPWQSAPGGMRPRRVGAPPPSAATWTSCGATASPGHRTKLSTR
jgi:hypothetical protein